ncbi:MAG TPA: nucleotide exchange factor GrpE [Patescibacteria group bacterium]|nr:nucleotide exchange factor GrpE [Patescibacteria group bacterium]
MSKKKNEEKEEKSREKCDEFENQLKHSLADYQNLEKRVAKDRGNWIKLANKQILIRLLPALDALLLAEKHTKDEGVSLSIKTFIDALREEGVERIEVKGKDFDPLLMECVQVVEGEEGKVIEEVKSGFILYDKVLRPAQVIVGKLN